MAYHMGSDPDTSFGLAMQGNRVKSRMLRFRTEVSEIQVTKGHYCFAPSAMNLLRGPR